MISYYYDIVVGESKTVNMRQYFYFSNFWAGLRIILEFDFGLEPIIPDFTGLLLDEV